MPTNIETIEDQRRAIQRAQQQAQELAAREQVSKAQLLQKQQGISARAKRQAESRIKKRASQRQLAQISQAQTKFEREVAQKAPEYAQEKFKAQAFKEAEVKVSAEVKNLQGRIDSLQATLNNPNTSDKARENADRTLQGVTAKYNVYSSALQGSPEVLIKKHYSGQLGTQANFASDQIRSSTERGEQKQAFATQQGFKSFQEYEKAYDTQQLAVRTQPAIVSETRIKVPTPVPTQTITEPAEGYKAQGVWETVKGKIRSATGLDKPPTATAAQTAAWESVKETVRDIGGPVVAAASVPVISASSPPIQGFKSTQPWLDSPSQLDVSTPTTPQIDSSIPTYYVPEGRGYDPSTLSPTQKKAVITGPGQKPAITREDIGYVAEQVVRPISEIPIWDKEIKIPAIIGPGGSIPTGLTIGEAAAAPAKAAEDILDFSAKGWEDLYDKTYGKIELQPMTWVGSGPKPRRNTVEWKQAVVLGTLVPTITGEKVGKVVSTAGQITTYAVPYVGVSYLASQTAKGIGTYKHPEKEANKIFEDYYKEYLAGVKESQQNLREGEYLDIKSKEELRETILPQIISQVKTEGAIEAGTSIAFLGAVGAAKGVSKTAKFVGEEIKIIEPARALQKDRELIAETKKVIVGDKGVDFQKFLVSGEKRPPLKITTTTKARDVFGFGPKEVKEVPAITFRQTSYNPLTGKKWVPTKGPSYAVEIESGKKYGTFYLIEGKSIPRDLKSFEGLTKREIFEWKKLAEKIAGRPVSEKVAFKLLKEESLKYQGETISKRLFRFKKGAEDEILVTTPWKPGKSITRGESVSEVIPVVQKEGAGIFTVKEVSKDVTKPFARATGETEFTKGLIIQRKPITIKTGEGKGFVQPADIKKTPIKDTFQIQETKQVFDVRLPPKPKPSKIPTVQEQIPSKDGKPFMVGGTGLVLADPLPGPTYKPTYEVTTTQLPPIMRDSIQQPAIIAPEAQTPFVNLGLYDRLGTAGLQQDFLKDATRLREAALLKDQTILRDQDLLRDRTFEVLKPVQISTPQFKSIQESAQRSEQLFKQIPIQRQVPVQRQVLAPRTIPRTRTIPRQRIQPPRTRFRILPPVLLTRPKPPRKPARPQKKVPSRGYNFEVRKRGKWVRARNPFAFATKAGAEAHAQEKVLGTAAASYKVVKAKPGRRVKKTGKKLRPKDQALFRPGKGGATVQKKRLRILSPGEKKEISFVGAAAKRKAPRKKTKTKTKKKQKGGKKK